MFQNETSIIQIFKDICRRLFAFKIIIIFYLTTFLVSLSPSLTPKWLDYHDILDRFIWWYDFSKMPIGKENHISPSKSAINDVGQVLVANVWSCGHAHKMAGVFFAVFSIQGKVNAMETGLYTNMKFYLLFPFIDFYTFNWCFGFQYYEPDAWEQIMQMELII